MELLAACDQFAELSLSELDALIPNDAIAARCMVPGVGRGVVLVCIAAAGVQLSGRLDDCRTLDDLRSGFEHFLSLWNCGVIGDDDWSAAATDALKLIEESFQRTAMQIGEAEQRDRSRAELN